MIIYSLTPPFIFITLLWNMKKRAREQAPKNFEHSPFKALKGFAPSPRGEKQKPMSLRGRKQASEDDSELFLRAVDGVKKIRPDEEPAASAAAKPRNALPDRPSVVRRDEQLFLDAMRNIRAVRRSDLDEEDAGHRRSASRRMKQLKRGTIRISAELDLHGYLRDEAIRQLNRFITSAFTRGLSSVLVITGKGINSPDGPVLPGAVADWLRTAGKGMVAEFSPAPRELGGSGAFVVFLKRA